MAITKVLVIRANKETNITSKLDETTLNILDHASVINPASKEFAASGKKVLELFANSQETDVISLTVADKTHDTTSVSFTVGALRKLVAIANSGEVRREYLVSKVKGKRGGAPVKLQSIADLLA